MGRQREWSGVREELPGEDRQTPLQEPGRGVGGGLTWLTVEGVGVVFFLSRPGKGLAGTLAVLLALRPDSRSSSGLLFSALLL